MSYSSWSVQYIPLPQKILDIYGGEVYKDFMTFVEEIQNEHDLSLSDIVEHFMFESDEVMLEAGVDINVLETMYSDVQKAFARGNIEVELFTTSCCGNLETGEDFEGMIVTNKLVNNPDISHEFHALLELKEVTAGG